MKKPPFIKLYVKDFAFDTQDLSNEELGAYMRVFLKSYKSGKISQKNHEESLFIELKNSISSYDAVCKRNRKNRTKTKDYKNDSSTSGQRVVDDLVNHEPITNNHEPRTRNIPPIVPQGGFDEWYKLYPHKVGRGSAEKAFKKAIKLTSLQDLIAGLERYKASKPPDIAWCNPATWLNQHRWLDQPQHNTELISKGKSNGTTFDNVADQVRAELRAERGPINRNDRTMLRSTRHLRENGEPVEDYDAGFDFGT